MVELLILGLGILGFAALVWFFLRKGEDITEPVRVKMVQEWNDYLYRAKLLLKNREIEVLLFSKRALKPGAVVIVEKKAKNLFKVKKVINA